MPYFVGVLPGQATGAEAETTSSNNNNNTTAGGDNKQLLSKCHSFKYLARGQGSLASLPFTSLPSAALPLLILITQFAFLSHSLSLFLLAVPAVDSSTSSSSSSASSAIVTVSVTPSSLSSSSAISSTTESLLEQQQPQGKHPRCALIAIRALPILF